MDRFTEQPYPTNRIGRDEDGYPPKHSTRSPNPANPAGSRPTGAASGTRSTNFGSPSIAPVMCRTCCRPAQLATRWCARRRPLIRCAWRSGPTKRALVAATLIATSASEFFTQDVEDADSFGRNIDTGSHPPGTREAQECVRDRKLEELRPKPAVPVGPDAGVKPWRNFGEMRRVFEQIREQVGETLYREELERAGVQNPGQFQSASRALECYGRLARIAARPEVA